MLALALLPLLTANAASDPLAALSPRLRVDPLVTMVAGGLAVGADVAVPETAWRLSTAVFIVEVPRFLVPFVVDAPPSLRIVEHCAQLGAFVFVDGDGSDGGFFVGPELYGYRLGYADDADPRHHDEAWELYAHVTAGAVWFPFDDDAQHEGGLAGRFFLQPWATLGLPVFGTGGASFVDGTGIHDRLFNWHATVALGLAL